MREWIALAETLVLAFVAYQFCQFCREQNSRMKECFVGLCRNFVDDFTEAMLGPRS
jgi:hypothetical protein